MENKTFEPGVWIPMSLIPDSFRTSKKNLICKYVYTPDDGKDYQKTKIGILKFYSDMCCNGEDGSILLCVHGKWGVDSMIQNYLRPTHFMIVPDKEYEEA